MMFPIDKVYNVSYNPDDMEQMTAQLKKLGLGDHEALVYGTLTLSSPASATFIAKRCGLSRSSVYTTISSLIAKGLVGTTYKNDVKQFIAQDFASLEHMVKKEKESIDKKFQLIEQLKKLPLFGQKDTQLPQILFFEGQEGLKKIYLSMMRQAPKNSTLYLLRDEFVWQPAWKFIFEQDWHGSVRRWKKEKNIRTKLLVNESTEEEKHRTLYMSKTDLAVRYLPVRNRVEGFGLYILGDTIAILSMEHNNLVGIKIVNAHLAKNFVQTFSALWAKC